MLSTKVKASAITHLTDARYFAAWEVRWLGFNLAPGDENHISPNQVNAIRAWVDGPLITGEFNATQDANDIRAAIDLLQLDAVQVDALSPVDTLIELEQKVPVIKEVIIDRDSNLFMLSEELMEFAPHVEAFLLNFSKGGLQWSDIGGFAPFDATELKNWAEQYPLLMDIDFGASNVAKILEEYPFYGLSLRGSAEEQVGLKSFDELDDIFEQLEVLI